MILKRRMILSLIVVLIVAAISQYSFVFPSYAEEKETTINFLPIIFKKYPLPPTVFGGEIFSFTNNSVVQLASEAKLSWARITAFDWSKIEPEPVNDPADYDWSSVPAESFEKMDAEGIHAIAIVKMTPEWAQKIPGVYCGPIAQEHFSDFAAFLKAAVQKYSQEPYNVRYWELGNEPDVDPALLSNPKSVFGCWGDETDDYYGGGYYASMLKVAYPAIKSADPRANVLIGGLLLDCDPGDPECTNPKTSRFFEGILRNGGGEYFDIVSFHGYPYYWGGKIHDQDHQNWNEQGGVVLGKIKFLRDVMSDYGINKPLLLSEGGLLCPETNTTECDPPGKLFEDAKADYVVWLYTRAIAHNLEGSIWYTFYGNAWRNSALVIDPDNPTPAYYALKFMTNELSEAKYTGRPANVNSKLFAYAFRVPGKSVWVIWSGDGNEYSLTLPTGYSNIYDQFGNPKNVSGDQISVLRPIYIELP